MVAITEENALEELGIEIEWSGPAPQVKDDWPCIQYQGTIIKAGKSYGFEYFLGIGHVKNPKGKFGIPLEFMGVFDLYKHKPYAQLKDKRLAAEYAVYLAKKQKVKPDNIEALNCLARDAQAHHETFENWAYELGYDTDSRKAEDIYKACCAIWFGLTGLGLSPEQIEEIGALEM